MFAYTLTPHSKKQLKLRKKTSKCLYLDEVIDIKFIKGGSGEFAVLCSNSETLKLYNTRTGDVELYPGHSDIILCIDTHSGEQCLILTGSKDNQIRLWEFDLEGKFQKKIRCLAVFKGHTENISSVCFAPKRREFFASVG